MFKRKKDVVKLNGEQLERMKELALNKVYFCGGDIYRYLNGDILPKLLNDIGEGSVQLSSSIVYGKNVITKEEKFLENLDRYIWFIRDNFHIDYAEQILLIELGLNNKYNKILYCLDSFHTEENYYKYQREFMRMYMYNFYENIKYYSKYASSFSNIGKMIVQLKKYKYNNDKDIEEIFNIFKEVLRLRNNNIYNSFVPYSETKEIEKDFYVFQVNWVLTSYYEEERDIFEIKKDDNFIKYNDNDKLIFNIKSDINVKDDDNVIIEFGIKNKNFNAKRIGIELRKKDIKDILKRLSVIDIKDVYDVTMDFIDPALRFNFWSDRNQQYLNIIFEYSKSTTDTYTVALNQKDIKSLYKLIKKQIDK